MLKKRIITATLLCAVLIPAMFFLSNTLWAITMLLISIIALWEWGHFIKLNTKWLSLYVLFSSVIGIVLVSVLEQFGFHFFFINALKLFMLVSMFWLIVAPLWLAKRLIIRQKILMALLGLLLILSLWLALVCAKAVDPALLLTLVATICIADSAAYFAGKNFGKNKLAPNISPGKTWEGVFGALIAVSIFALALYNLANIHHLMLFPLLWVVVYLGVMGDLFESLMKRQANLKDSGSLLPGHGGVLDRIDGLIPSLPIALLMIYLYHYFNLAKI